MPDFRQSGDKPLRPQDNLGPNVEITDMPLVDPWAQNTLRDIGKAITPAQHTYMGSVAIHYFRTGTDAVLTDNKVGDVALAQQLCLSDINEYIAMMGLSDMAVKMRQHYGRSHSTRDTKDRRGKT